MKRFLLWAWLYLLAGFAFFIWALSVLGDEHVKQMGNDNLIGLWVLCELSWPAILLVKLLKDIGV